MGFENRVQERMRQNCVGRCGILALFGARIERLEFKSFKPLNRYAPFKPSDPRIESGSAQNDLKHPMKLSKPLSLASNFPCVPSVVVLAQDSTVMPGN